MRTALRHFALIALSFILGGPLAFLAADRQPPYQFISTSISPVDPEPGSMIIVQREFKILRAPDRCVGRVDREIVDSHGTVWVLAGEEVSIGSATDTRRSRPVQLPYAIASGQARYRSMFTFSCNPLHKLFPIIVRTPEVVFTIGARKVDKKVD